MENAHQRPAPLRVWRSRLAVQGPTAAQHAMNGSGMAGGGIVVPDFLQSDFFNSSPPGLYFAAA